MERHVPFFEPLARFVRTKPGREIMIISLADYVSKEDEARFYDVATAMRTAWEKHELPKRPQILRRPVLSQLPC